VACFPFPCILSPPPLTHIYSLFTLLIVCIMNEGSTTSLNASLHDGGRASYPRRVLLKAVPSEAQSLPVEIHLYVPAETSQGLQHAEILIDVGAGPLYDVAQDTSTQEDPQRTLVVGDKRKSESPLEKVMRHHNLGKRPKKPAHSPGTEDLGEPFAFLTVIFSSS